jgi:hypothetical protein
MKNYAPIMRTGFIWLGIGFSWVPSTGQQQFLGLDDGKDILTS